MTGICRTLPACAARFAAVMAAAAWLAGCSASRDLAAQRAAPEPDPIEAGVAPPAGPYAPGFDALHYDVEIVLPDTGSYIEGRTTGRFRLVEPLRDTLALDLTGLAVDRVEIERLESIFTYEAGKLHVPVPSGMRAGDTVRVHVTYRGRPDDGLILGTNLHGEPTAFADNWPNRARFWFPSIDHPSDKATVQFEVYVNPDTGRRVVANGAVLESGNAHRWRWSVEHPIPTYTMVIGAAEFHVDTVGTACHAGVCTDVTTWLFPPDADRGAASFRRAAEMVEFFSELVAPFPYAKLAHVQSSTRFGGMENVGAIFYAEEPIHEGRDIERTVAHETAHQWFGDAVTESDWHHLWLSEGFATYFAALYFEHADGTAAFREIMNDYRVGYLASDVHHEPIVNPEQGDLFQLLNANNYNKGAWVLHMLRVRLGDEAFFDAVRAYYNAHAHGTALTVDVLRAFEEASGTPLEDFFTQWVFQPGHPRLDVRWARAGGAATVEIRQVQPSSWPVYEFPLVLAFETENGLVRRTVHVGMREETFRVDLPDVPTGLTIDPDGDLLTDVVSVRGY